MRISRPDHAELEGIGTDPIFNNQSAHQSGPRIVPCFRDTLPVLEQQFAVVLAQLPKEAVTEHVFRFGALHRNQVIVGFIVGEFVGGR